MIFRQSSPQFACVFYFGWYIDWYHCHVPSFGICERCQRND